MRRIVLAIIATVFLSGCGYFTASQKLKECNLLLDESKERLTRAVIIVDSLQKELDKCQSQQ